MGTKIRHGGVSYTTLNDIYLRLDGTNIPTANYNWTTNLTTTGTLQGGILTDGTFQITGGVGTGLVSLTDGTATWAGSNLAGFGTIQANTSVTASTLTIAGGSITDTTGAISFGNENLSTTGSITGNTMIGTVSGTFGGTLTIASGSITDTTGAIGFGNENLTTTGNIQGTNVTGTTSVVANTMTMATGSITDTTGAISFGNENLTTTGTVQAEQLTSTDDIAMQGHALNLGDVLLATDTVINFYGSTNSGSITYDESLDTFNFGSSYMRVDHIGMNWPPSANYSIYINATPQANGIFCNVYNSVGDVLGMAGFAAGGGAGQTVYGMKFDPRCTVLSTNATLIGCQIQNSFFGSRATTAIGTYIQMSWATNITNYLSKAINYWGGAGSLNIGIDVESVTGATTNYSIRTAGGQVRIVDNTTGVTNLDVRKNIATATVPVALITQDSTTGAQPCLALDQDDVSEGCIDFLASARGVITGATNSVQSVRVELNGTVYRIALYADA